MTASSTISKICQTRQRPVSSIFICPRSPPCLSSRVRDVLAEAGSQLFFTLAQSNASAPLIPKVFDAFCHVRYCFGEDRNASRKTLQPSFRNGHRKCCLCRLVLNQCLEGFRQRGLVCGMSFSRLEYPLPTLMFS